MKKAVVFRDDDKVESFVEKRTYLSAKHTTMLWGASQTWCTCTMDRQDMNQNVRQRWYASPARTNTG